MGITKDTQSIPSSTVVTLDGELTLVSGDVLMLTVNGVEQASQIVPEGKTLVLSVRMVGQMTTA